MRAFTHLCSKVNISLFDDTITLYPKIPSSDAAETEENVYLACQEAMIEMKARLCLGKLEIERYIRYYDPLHDRYHQDEFPRNDTHYHAKFPTTIDEPKLRKIIGVFAFYDLVSHAERDNFLAAYREANNLNTVSEEATSSAAVIPAFPALPKAVDTGSRPKTRFFKDIAELQPNTDKNSRFHARSWDNETPPSKHRKIEAECDSLPTRTIAPHG